MEFWEAILLGAVQGLTEFLPISSSAHLRILGEFLPSGIDPGAAFTAITQIGTELAVVLYFRREILRLSLAWLRQVLGRPHERDQARLAWMIAVGTLPIVVLGLMFQSYVETALRNLYLTAAMLIVFAVVLGLADRYGKRRSELKDLTWRDGMLFGFAQALALIPGVSRSGGTISAGLTMGYTREAAARYSFLLAIPAVFGSGFYQLAKSAGEPQAVGGAETAIATLTAFVIGYAVIIGFLKLISTRSFAIFVYYRFALGAFILLLLWAKVISPDGSPMLLY